jgi:hypothetical protein
MFASDADATTRSPAVSPSGGSVGPVDPLEPDEVAALARAAGLDLSPDRLERAGRDLDQLLRLAAALRELPIDGVEPVLGPPAWE